MSTLARKGPPEGGPEVLLEQRGDSAGMRSEVGRYVVESQAGAEQRVGSGDGLGASHDCNAFDSLS